MLLLISGASGAGKTTVRRAIAPALAPRVEAVELADLVASPPVLTLAWRQQSAETAVLRAIELASEGRHLLLSGDPVVAGEVVAAPSAPQLGAMAILLLDANAEVQAARLAQRGDDPALLVHHQNFAAWMRAHAADPLERLEVLSSGGWEEMRWERLSRLGADWAMEVLDTSALGPGEVAGAARDWVERALAGRAPIIRVPPDQPAPPGL